MKQTVLYISIGILIGAASAALVFGFPTVSKPFALLASLVREQKPQRPYDPDITEDNERMFHDEGALYSYIKKFGPKKSIMRLHALSAQYGNCHDTAHKAGRFSYELRDDRAFQECSSECHSGCYHGATEAYFRDHGTANLSQNLGLLCNEGLNAFFSHQCVHGIGHGLMAWTNYDLPEALKSCDLLSAGQSSCWTGVFMENIVGGLARPSGQKTDKDAARITDQNAQAADTDHFTAYLNDDPHFPCTIVEEKYKGSCYFLQTSRMMQLFSSDFGRIASACAHAPEPYLQSCFESMGRDVGGTHRHDAKSALAACAKSPKSAYRQWCLNGAVQDGFWDPSGQEYVLQFCSLVADASDKESCYNTIFERAPQILDSEEKLALFCGRAETDYREACRAKTGMK